MQKKAVSVEGSSDGCHVTGIKLGEKDHEPKHVSCWWKLRTIRHLFSQSSRKKKFLLNLDFSIVCPPQTTNIQERVSSFKAATL